MFYQESKMLLERAKRKCKECYTKAEEIIKKYNEGDGFPYTKRCRRKIESSRAIVNARRSTIDALGEVGGFQNEVMAFAYQNTCLRCNHRYPRVAREIERG